jgi:hypothetical protein
MNYYAWFFVFSVVLYLIVTDESVAAAFYYVFKLIKFNYEKQKWWLLNNPANPIVKYLMWRKSYKLAQELINEMKNKQH